MRTSQKATTGLQAALLLLLLPGCAENKTADTAVEQSVQLIKNKGCISCHTLSSIPGATGNVGPPLDHFSERAYIAGLIPNTKDNLIHWLLHPAAVHGDTAMPDSNLTRDEATLISRYLWQQE